MLIKEQAAGQRPREGEANVSVNQWWRGTFSPAADLEGPLSQVGLHVTYHRQKEAHPATEGLIRDGADSAV